MPVTFTVPRTSGYATSSRQSLFQIPCVRVEKQLTRQCVNGGVYATRHCAQKASDSECRKY